MNFTEVLTIVLTFITSGGLGTFIGLRWKSKSEKAKAEQESAKADTIEISNVNDVISLYKQALIDFKELKDQDDRTYLKKIEEYEVQLIEYRTELQSYKEDLKSKENLIQELTKSQLKIKLELDSLKASSLEKCESCEFRSTCEKYKAKQLNK